VYGGAVRTSASFTVVKANSIDIYPLPKMTYEKDTQTEGGAFSAFNLDMSMDEVDDYEEAEFKTPKTKSRAQVQTPGPGGDRTHQTPAVSKRVISEEEYHETVSGSNFLNFLRESSLYMDRALEQNDLYDVMRNYSKDRQQSSKTDSFAFSCKPLQPYEDESLKCRPIMDLSWSPHNNELYVIAYGSKVQAKEPVVGKGAAVAISAGSGDDDVPGMVSSMLLNTIYAA
jgi:hypothetical protein